MTGPEGAALSRQHQPNPSAAPVQKLRVRYAKRGKLRFTSHRDVARTLERALRRAGAPMAYSQGFNPHPKVSWIGAAPTGTASEAEYVEIQLVTRVDPALLAGELDAALPPGLDVLEVVEAGPGSLPDRIDASQWQIELPGVDPDRLREAAGQVLAAAQIDVERATKDGHRTIDARAAIVSLEVASATTRLGDGPKPAERCGILMAVVRQTTPAVRPDDVLSAFRVVADLAPPVPAKATRMAQGRLDDSGRLADPLAPDREATPPVLGAPVVGEWAAGQSVVAGPAV